MLAEGKYCDGKTTVHHNVQVSLHDEGLWILDFNKFYHGQQIVVHSSVGKNTYRRLDFDDGSFLMIHSQVKLPQWKKSKRDIIGLLAEKVEKHKLALGSSVILLILGIWFWMSFGTKVTTWLVVKFVPNEYMSKFSGKILESLERNNILSESKLSENQKKVLLQKSRQISALYGINVELKFYDAGFPNAFALPGGVVVMLDDLVEMTSYRDSLEDIVGVLAHEIGHVYYHHSVENMVRERLIKLLTGVDASILSNTAFQMIFLSYSREAEKQADEFAAQSLKKINVSTMPLAELFEKIKDKEFTYSKDLKWANILSTHPLTEDRIEFFKSQAK